MRINLIHKSITDQLDSHDLQYTTTHTQHKCVPRMPPTTTATLNIGTFTFTAPNHCQGIEENMAPKREKREQEYAKMVDVVLKKTTFKGRKKVGAVLAFLKNVGCTSNNAGST